MVERKWGFLAVVLAAILSPFAVAQTPTNEYAVVPSPGPLNKVASVGDLSLRYPSNWTEVHQGGSWMFFPPEGVVEKEGKQYYRYGFWVIPIGSGQSTAGNLQPTANRLFFALQQANHGMFEVSENDRTVLGGPAVSMNFENSTPPGAPDEPETGTLITVLVVNNRFIALVMFAPKRDMEANAAYPSTFENMIATLKFGAEQQSPTNQQGAHSSEQSTYRGTAAAGWSGPCEKWWETSAFAYDAMRVCRVATYLMHAFMKNKESAESWKSAREGANQAFRICWGNFPQSGGACNTPNAWALPKSWLVARQTGQAPHPIFITLTSTEWLQSDDEIAFVLSHEMGHATDAGQNTTQNTRQNEERADALGIGYMMLAGYDARSAGRGLQMIEGERGQGVLGNLGNMLSRLGDATDPHGYAHERIELMKQEYARLCSRFGNKPIGCKEGWN
jgi:hypothetical protein